MCKPGYISILILFFLFIDCSAKMPVSAEHKVDRSPPFRPISWSWLPDKDLDQAVMRLMICRYDKTNLISTGLLQNGSYQEDDCQWSVEVERKGVEMEVKFRLEKGRSASSGVAIAFDFANWNTDNYVLAPAALYNGNRFRALNYSYPPYIYDEQYRPLDMPITITDVQRLSADGQHAKVEFMTGNCSTPMLAFYDSKAQRGWIMLTEQGNDWGNFGLFVEEDPESARATFVISLPCVRQWRYVMTGRAPSGDISRDWDTGDEIKIKLHLYDFEANNLTAFFKKVFEHRKSLSGENTIRNIAPYSYISELIVEHFDRHKWYDHPKYPSYSNRPGSSSIFTYQIGWSGLPIYASAPAILETPERLQRVTKSLDTLLYAQADTGLFYAMHRNGEFFGDSFKHASENRSIAMIRRTGEVIYYGLRQLKLRKDRAHPIKPDWEQSFKKAADALVKIYDTYGQFGQFVDVANGKMVINGSTAGGVCITALALASEYFDEPEYLDIAQKAGLFYYQRDIKNGYAGGSPAEILQAPDMESAYNILEAFIVLYELTGLQEWLSRAEAAAYLFSTWMVSYDYVFPNDSDLGRVNARSTGSIFASVQNQHSSPGIYISSGDFLLKLYRATGNHLFGQMYRDTVHNVIQYVNTSNNPINQGGLPGAVSERVNLSDWEGSSGIGRVHAGDTNMAWETLAALTALENPGIYLQTDKDILLVLDHIEATVLEHDKDGLILEIKNTTPYPAKVSIFAETSTSALQPLGWNAFEKWPKVEIYAGSEILCRITIDGDVSVINK